MDKIIISSLDCIEACMRLALHRYNIKNGNIVRQYFVQPETKVKTPILLNIHMEKELTGMYPGVRPSATNNSNGFLEQFAYCSFQNLLHIQYPRMFLPAAVPCAMIGYMKEISQLAFVSGQPGQN